ncbi:aldo/keto reductase [Tistrella mobilis]
MRYRRLGRSGLLVSEISLGTMTFGAQLDERTAVRIMAEAFEAGVNLFDTAEMYAVPQTPETQGASERILGAFLKTVPRDRVIVATKVSGPGDGPGRGIVGHIRGGLCALDRFHIERAVEESLKRLGTDVIDLYQTHWPDRVTPMDEQLEALDRLVRAGKVRYPGVSNETPWGLTRLAARAEALGTARIVSLQNVYHLLKRVYDDGMSEVCVNEGIGMLAFSPIAMGVLTGKYGAAGGAGPEDRLNAFPPRFQARYGHARAITAADRYVALAREHGLHPATMAVAWTIGRPGIASALPGVSRPDQLAPILAAADLDLAPDLLQAIEAVHREMPNPVV